MARSDTALWSINERLGQLLEHLGAESIGGTSLSRPNMRWATELLKVFQEAAEDEDAPSGGKDPLPNVPDMAITS